MKNKKLIIEVICIIVIALCLCLGYYYYDSSRNKSAEIVEEKVPDEDNIIYEDYDSGEIAQNSEGALGILRIPAININRGFIKSESGFENTEKCIEKNICTIKWSDDFYKENNSIALIAYGSEKTNGYFKNIDKLKKGNVANIEFNNKTYTYVYTESYKDTKSDNMITFHMADAPTLHLVTTKDAEYYYIVDFVLVGEE